MTAASEEVAVLSFRAARPRRDHARQPAGLKNGRAKAVRFTTLTALCEVLECQPGDLLRWEAEDAEDG